MKKKLFNLLLVLSFLVLSPMLVNAGGSDDDYNTVTKEYTNDAVGGYTKNECARYDYCTWSDTLNAGVTSKGSYECHYWNETGGVQRMVTAHFNANGLVKLEYQTNDIRSVNEQFKAFTNENSSSHDFYYEDSKTGLGYYFCPTEIYHDMDATWSEKKMMERQFSGMYLLQKYLRSFMKTIFLN